MLNLRDRAYEIHKKKILKIREELEEKKKRHRRSHINNASVIGGTTTNLEGRNGNLSEMVSYDHLKA